MENGKTYTERFFYGAALSWLFKNKINPALIDSDPEKQIIAFTTNHTDFLLLTRCRKENERINVDYSSWSFSGISKDICKLLENIEKGKQAVLALILLKENIEDCELALLFTTDVCAIKDKLSFTITYKKNDKYYYIRRGGERKKNGYPIPRNRTFDDLVKIKESTELN